MTASKECEILSVGYSYHSRPFHAATRDGFSSYLFRLQTEGRARATVNGESMTIVPGDLLLVPPGMPYELFIDAGAPAQGDGDVMSGDFYLFCRGEWLDRWWKESRIPAKLNLPSNADIVNIMRQLSVEQRRTDDKAWSITTHLLKAMCLIIGRSAEEQASYPQGKPSYLAYRMKHFIEEHATAPFALADVAQHVGLSVSRAVHLYKEIFGVSIMQYALDLRLSIARERIVFSQIPLEQVAETSGFGSYSYFHRLFRSRFGMSPRDYRQSQAQRFMST